MGPPQRRLPVPLQIRWLCPGTWLDVIGKEVLERLGDRNYFDRSPSAFAAGVQRFFLPFKFLQPASLPWLNVRIPTRGLL